MSVAPTPATADTAATTRYVSKALSRPGGRVPAAGGGRSEDSAGGLRAPPSLLSPSCIPQPFCPESTLASRFPAPREDQACRREAKHVLHPENTVPLPLRLRASGRKMAGAGWTLYA